MTAGINRLDRLVGVHPKLAEAIKAIIDELGDQGLTILITQGLRTTEQQAGLYAQGRSREGKIVTNVDGHTKKSMHQQQLDGFGHAVDVCWRVNGTVTWDGPWPTLGELARGHGLVWGGDWTHFVDRPHLELPMEKT